MLYKQSQITHDQIPNTDILYLNTALEDKTIFSKYILYLTIELLQACEIMAFAFAPTYFNYILVRHLEIRYMVIRITYGNCDC